ncbi:MAG: hypothetical protein ACRDPY_09735 [Streptosporangiaceae bacterium]
MTTYDYEMLPVPVADIAASIMNTPYAVRSYDTSTIAAVRHWAQHAQNRDLYEVCHRELDSRARAAEVGDAWWRAAAQVEAETQQEDIMTTATEDWRTHQQPCFCDTCWLTTIMDLIGERAVLLQAALTDRLYTDGLERDMADEVITAIPSARRGDVLSHMLEWEHLQPRIMMVDYLLDECDERSYETLGKIAEMLLDMIYAQGREGAVLRLLITNEISDPITAKVHSESPRHAA